MVAKVSLIDNVGNALKGAIQNMDAPIKNAATAAVTLAGINVRDRGRANIGGAGFSGKWQNTWKLKLYQVNPPQIDAAAWLYHLIPYSDVFEKGATIIPKLRKFLWIPLRTTPLRFGRKHISPRQLEADGVKLFPIIRKNKVPLLATKINGRPIRRLRSVSLRSLRKSSRAPSANQVTLPLFFGVSRVTLRKRFALGQIADEEANKLADYYFANLKDE